MITHDPVALPNPEFGARVPSLHPYQHQEEVPVLELLNEINAVAIKLRQRARAGHGTANGSSGAEHAVLEIIHRLGVATVPRIARERFTSRQNIQIIVDRLESEGLVEITGNPAHKRSMLVRLTDRGTAWLQKDEQRRMHFYEEIGVLLSEEELRVLRLALRKFHALLGKEGGQTQNGDEHRRGTPKNRQGVTPEQSEKSKTGSPNGAVRVELVEEQFPVNLL